MAAVSARLAIKTARERIGYQIWRKIVVEDVLFSFLPTGSWLLGSFATGHYLVTQKLLVFHVTYRHFRIPTKLVQSYQTFLLSAEGIKRKTRYQKC